MSVESLLIVIIALLIVSILLLLFLIFRGNSHLESAFYKAWKDTGIGEKIGEISAHARELKEIHRSLESMLRTPVQRGSFGEVVLEKILKDHLPPDMYGIRERLPNGKIPDAHVMTAGGLLCIDSKFPLDNYRRMVEADDGPDKEHFKRAFIDDVRRHLKKIKGDYICPEKGSLDFAFAFIPSESVYWFLVSEAFDMLNGFIREGVHVVSPLTLAHKLELIKMGVHARKLSQEAEEVKSIIIALGKQFEELSKDWNTFYNHTRNMFNRASDLKIKYEKLAEEFENIRRKFGG